MKTLRLKYEEEKANEKIAAIRVSNRAQAKSVAEKINLFQHEVAIVPTLPVSHSNFCLSSPTFYTSHRKLIHLGWLSVDPSSRLSFPPTMAVVPLTHSFGSISKWVFKMC